MCSVRACHRSRARRDAHGGGAPGVRRLDPAMAFKAPTSWFQPKKKVQNANESRKVLYYNPGTMFRFLHTSVDYISLMGDFQGLISKNAILGAKGLLKTNIGTPISRPL